MAKHDYPEFHKALLEQSSYPSAKRRVKFEETRSSYLYRTGEFVYSVRKATPAASSLAIKEVFAREALAIGQRWAPEVYLEVVPITLSGEKYALGGAGTVVDYALRMMQLADHYWLNKLIAQGKFNTATAGKVGRYLAERHAQSAPADSPSEAGRPEHLRELAEEVFYQVKKYVNVTVSAPILDTVMRPMFKFIAEHRKLFARRMKKGRVLECHGAFVPEHVHIKGKEICAVSPLAGPGKFRVLDAANDLATFLNELARLNAVEHADLMLKRYVTSSKDRDLAGMLPAYRTLQAMRSGLRLSEELSKEGLSEAGHGEIAGAAHAYFELAVQASREIPR